MKTLAENTSVRSLTLSGNAIDTTSARAVSYALALNRNLKELFMDNCSATYGAQRHIAAGIVSNKFSALGILRGFHLGGKRVCTTTTTTTNTTNVGATFYLKYHAHFVLFFLSLTIAIAFFASFFLYQ